MSSTTQTESNTRIELPPALKLLLYAVGAGVVMYPEALRPARGVPLDDGLVDVAVGLQILVLGVYTVVEGETIGEQAGTAREGFALVGAVAAPNLALLFLFPTSLEPLGVLLACGFLAALVAFEHRDALRSGR